MSIIDYENSFEIIDSIVDSTHKLMSMLKNDLTLNISVFSTIEQIFLLLKRVLSLLPDFVIVDKNIEKIKQELLNTYYLCNEKWKEFGTNPKDFFDTWDNFYDHWVAFDKSVKEITSDRNVVYISMN